VTVHESTKASEQRGHAFSAIASTKSQEVILYSIPYTNIYALVQRNYFGRSEIFETMRLKI
jgi:hypothetical protein